MAPNLSALIGELVGARLISHAGSLTNLAKYPASTVQILGAEKALFRWGVGLGGCVGWGVRVGQGGGFAPHEALSSWGGAQVVVVARRMGRGQVVCGRWESRRHGVGLSPPSHPRAGSSCPAAATLSSQSPPARHLTAPPAAPPGPPSWAPPYRALKTKGNTPKYGLIFHSTFIGRAKQRNKGRISRYLANKCSIASRIDAFLDGSTDAFGTKLRDQVGAEGGVGGEVWGGGGMGGGVWRGSWGAFLGNLVCQSPLLPHGSAACQLVPRSLVACCCTEGAWACPY